MRLWWAGRGLCVTIQLCGDGWRLLLWSPNYPVVSPVWPIIWSISESLIHIRIGILLMLFTDLWFVKLNYDGIKCWLDEVWYFRTRHTNIRVKSHSLKNSITCNKPSNLYLIGFCENTPSCHDRNFSVMPQAQE